MGMVHDEEEKAFKGPKRRLSENICVDAPIDSPSTLSQF
jgi:hypothetical protein